MRPVSSSSRARLPILSEPAIDLLRPPATRKKFVRTLIRAIAFSLALALILDGFLGPALAPKNLATVVTWVHVRGWLVLALVAIGNLFCFACPFVFARDGLRRFIRPRFHWPRSLRNKWVSIALLVAVLFSYELFDLWSHPAGTAALILVYFGAILVIDALFTGAPFCKWVCPIGQFNFASALMSPFEVRALRAGTCEACEGKECIRGRRSAEDRVVQRGCELALFLPGKVGNLDCTLCLDCVYACPHDNVGLVSRVPGEELWNTSRRAGIGRLMQRRDLAALVVIFTFSALVNAFGMVSPVYAFARWLADNFGIRSDLGVLAVIYTGGLLVAPAILIFGTAALTRSKNEPLLEVATRFSYALAPLGFGVWIAHYTFHLFTGFLTFVPVFERAMRDLGVYDRAPAWRLGGLSPEAVYPIELGFIAFGALVSWVAVFRLNTRSRAAALPWAVLVLLLGLASIWLLSQPMEMRGTFLGGG